jgi:hypothetical protein
VLPPFPAIVFLFVRIRIILYGQRPLRRWLLWR